MKVVRSHIVKHGASDNVAAIYPRCQLPCSGLASVHPQTTLHRPRLPGTGILRSPARAELSMFGADYPTSATTTASAFYDPLLDDYRRSLPGACAPRTLVQVGADDVAGMAAHARVE